MPEDLKLSQIGSSQLPPPFRGLYSPGVRKLLNYLCLSFPEIVYCSVWHVLRLFVRGPKARRRILHVLYRRGTCQWKARGADWRRVKRSTERRSNKMADSSIRMSLLFFRLILLRKFQTLRQRQGETVYPRSRSTNPSPHKTPFYLSGEK